MHTEIRDEISKLNFRTRQVRRSSGSQRPIREQMALIASRSLFSMFVDRALWQHTDRKEIEAVRDALHNCRRAIRNSRLCKRFILQRIESFEEVIKRPHLEIRDGN